MIKLQTYPVIISPQGPTESWSILEGRNLQFCVPNCIFQSLLREFFRKLKLQTDVLNPHITELHAVTRSEFEWEPAFYIVISSMPHIFYNIILNIWRFFLFIFMVEIKVLFPIINIYIFISDSFLINTKDKLFYTIYKKMLDLTLAFEFLQMLNAQLLVFWLPLCYNIISKIQ